MRFRVRARVRVARACVRASACAREFSDLLSCVSLVSRACVLLSLALHSLLAHHYSCPSTRRAPHAAQAGRSAYAIERARARARFTPKERKKQRDTHIYNSLSPKPYTLTPKPHQPRTLVPHALSRVTLDAALDVAGLVQTRSCP